MEGIRVQPTAKGILLENYLTHFFSKVRKENARLQYQGEIFVYQIGGNVMDYATYLQKQYTNLEGREKMPINGKKPFPTEELELFLGQLKELVEEHQSREKDTVAA